MKNLERYYSKKKLDKLLKEITILDLELEQVSSKLESQVSSNDQKHKGRLKNKREKLLKEIIHERCKYYDINY